MTASVRAESKPLKPLDVHRKNLLGMGSYFTSALPVTARKYLTPTRITQIVCTAIGKSPLLLQCTPASILMSTMDIVQLALEPGGPLGHAYLVPFKNNKKGTYEATAIIGYKGYVVLAMRTGLFLAPPQSHLVYANDKFEWDRGSGEPPRHIVPLAAGEEERGPIIGGYCAARFVGGGTHTEAMSLGDILRSRDRSRASNSGPWVTDTNQMMRKTLIRRARNYWPLSGDTAGDISAAMAVDERSESDGFDPGLIYEPEFLEQIQKLPETVDGEPGAMQSKSQQLAQQITEKT